jgi:hypothetical protein
MLTRAVTFRRLDLTIFTNFVEDRPRKGEHKQQYKREEEMLSSDAMHGVYDPDTLKAMGAAFDTAVQAIPPHLQDHERARRRLALLIVRHMESGETDANLGTVALLDFLRATQWQSPSLPRPG